jgi:hypothetical protein
VLDCVGTRVGVTLEWGGEFVEVGSLAWAGTALSLEGVFSPDFGPSGRLATRSSDFFDTGNSNSLSVTDALDSAETSANCAETGG